MKKMFPDFRLPLDVRNLLAAPAYLKECDLPGMIHLAGGNVTRMGTDAEVAQAKADEALQQRKGRGYAPPIGSPTLRMEAAEELDASWENTVITPGGRRGIALIFRWIQRFKGKPGNVVVVPVNTWPGLKSWASANHFNVVEIRRGKETLFDLAHLEQVLSAVGEHISAIGAVTPDNPTGKIIVRNEFEEIERLRQEYASKAFFVSDETYRRLVADESPETFCPARSVVREEKLILLVSRSKDARITGGIASVVLPDPHGVDFFRSSASSEGVRPEESDCQAAFAYLQEANGNDGGTTTRSLMADVQRDRETMRELVNRHSEGLATFDPAWAAIYGVIRPSEQILCRNRFPSRGIWDIVQRAARYGAAINAVGSTWLRVNLGAVSEPEEIPVYSERLAAAFKSFS